MERPELPQDWVEIGDQRDFHAEDQREGFRLDKSEAANPNS
jgi:hypothetical protein